MHAYDVSIHIQSDPLVMPCAHTDICSVYGHTLQFLQQSALAHTYIQHEPLYRQAVLRVLFEWSFARGQYQRAHYYHRLLASLATTDFDLIDAGYLQGR
jgi:hypothetical protein